MVESDYAEKLIDGKKISAEVREEIREEVEKLGIKPGLAVVLVGSRPDSATYVKNKTKSALECGFKVEDFKFPETVTEEEVLATIDSLNKDNSFHGILVQLPLPPQINEQTVLRRIEISKVSCRLL